MHLLGPSTGGIRLHVDFLAQQLEERGWEVAVAGPAGVMDGLRPLDAEVGVGHVWSFRRALRQLRPDVLHAHGLKAGTLAGLLAGRIPTVVSVHNLVRGSRSGGPAAAAMALVEGRIPFLADAVIATSDEVAARFADVHGADRVQVVAPLGPPPTPRRDRAEVRRALGAAPAQPLIVTVARLHPQKGLDVLLEAVAKLRSEVPDVRLAIVGEGPLLASLQANIERLGLGAAVVLAGPSPNAADEMAVADVVAVSSRWESGPLVVAEAMLLGRPVVATAVGWVPQLVLTGRTGRMVPPGDADALATALAATLHDPAGAASMAEDGRARVLSHLGVDALVDGVEAVYNHLLHR